MAMQYWICPSCDTSVHEEYLNCRCGYRTTKDEIEKSKIPLQEVIKRVDERKKSKEKENQGKEEKLKDTQSSKSCLCPHCEEFISEAESLCPFCAEPIGGKGAEPVQLSTPSGNSAESVGDTEGIKSIKPASPGSDERLKNKMSRLNDLFANGFITQKEYDDKKQQLLNEYLNV